MTKIVLLTFKETTNGNYRFYNAETGDVIPWLAGVCLTFNALERIREREEADKSVQYTILAKTVVVDDLLAQCSRIRDALKDRKYVVKDMTQEPEMDATHPFAILFRQIVNALIDRDSVLRREMFQRKREMLALKKASEPQ